MTFLSYPIDTGHSINCIAIDGQYNASNNLSYASVSDTHFCTYNKVVSGVQQIFIAYSTDGGETWTPEQVTTLADVRGAYNKYGSSCAVDINGTGLHLVYASKGYGPTANRRAGRTMMYKFRDASGVWSAEQVTGSVAEEVTYRQYYQPCIAIDSSDNVHMACIYGNSYSSFFGWTTYLINYVKRNSITGVWGDRAYLYYGVSDATGNYYNLRRPNIQVDSYGNPQIVCHCLRPITAYDVQCYTTVWFANLQQGALAGWPRIYFVAPYWVYSPIYERINSHILCDKDRSGPGGTGSPGDANSPSTYARLALSHSSVGDNCYYDGVNEYDYPHCVYNFSRIGFPDPIGTYYTWKDDYGWHDELISVGPASSPNPSVAINPDGKIHTIIPAPITAGTYDYRQRATYDEPWGLKVSTPNIYYPRQLVQLNSTQYPMNTMACSPFLAMSGATGTELKFFKCADVVTGYGYFM